LTRSLHKVVPIQKNFVKQVHRDPPEILVLPDTQDTRAEKEPQGNLALEDLWVVQECMVQEENKGLRGHGDSRARKVSKVPFVLQGTKEMLDQWEKQDIKDRLA